MLALSCLLLGFATLRGGLDGLDRLTGLVPSIGFTLVTTPTVTIDTSQPTVVQSVRALSKLETVHYQLEKVVKELEAGDLSLERSLELFERGMSLSDICRKQLEEAETRVEMLIRKDGKTTAEPFRPEKS